MRVVLEGGNFPKVDNCTGFLDVDIPLAALWRGRGGGTVGEAGVLAGERARQGQHLRGQPFV